MTSSRPTGTPASTLSSTQSKPLTLGERAQLGTPMTAVCTEPSEHHQVAGIDRHAQMHHVSSRRLEPGGNDIAAVDDGGGAEHQDRPMSLLMNGFDGLRHRLNASWPHRATSPKIAAERHKPRVNGLNALVEDLRFGLRQLGEHQADIMRLERSDADRCLAAAQGDRAVEHCSPTRRRE